MAMKYDSYEVSWHNINWPAVILLGLVHLFALLAFSPKFFSWSAVCLMFFLYWVTASLGICLGFHRYLTHRSFELPKWLAYFFVFCGVLACENGPIKWVAQHRMHHMGSDTSEDPHSARSKPFWWPHIGWMLFKNEKFDSKKVIDERCGDLIEDGVYVIINNFVVIIAIQVILSVILLYLGGWSWVIWGIFVRLVVTWHATWFINSASHWFGYKNFKMNDLSTNCWWAGILAFGEGWHNNHHAFPLSANHGMKPGEIDLTWFFIKILKKIGLVTDIINTVIVGETAVLVKDNKSLKRQPILV